MSKTYVFFWVVVLIPSACFGLTPNLINPQELRHDGFQPIKTLENWTTRAK